jgi:SAM-dependent methyltransferase
VGGHGRAPGFDGQGRSTVDTPPSARNELRKNEEAGRENRKIEEAARSAEADDRVVTSPHRQLAEMLLGSQIQQAIYVAARLGLADLLAGGPASAAELAGPADAHARSLHRLLRALAGMGLFVEDREGRFALTPLGALLRTDEPGSMRPFALWSGGVSYEAFGGLEESVRTGEPAFERIFGAEFFDYLGRHPEWGSVFDQMMARHTAPVARELATNGALEGVRTLVDVGGGTGELLAQILAARPALTGILVDRDRVLVGAGRRLAEVGVAERCSIVPADIATAVPAGGDAYLLKSVLHGLDDDAARVVLRNCRAAMDPDGRVLLVEFVLPPGNGQHPAKLMDLLMLIGCHGCERTEDEFRRLLASAGLRLAEVMPSRNAYSVLSASAAGA